MTTWHQYCSEDDRQYAIAKLEDDAYQSNLKAERASDIVWALVERSQPELLEGLPETNRGPAQLVDRLYEMWATSDDIADMLLKEWRSLLAQAEGDRDPIIDIDVPNDEDDWVIPDLDDVYVIGER